MSKIKLILIIAIGVVVGLIIGFGIGQVRLGNQDKMYQSKLKEVNQRFSQVQRKLSEERTTQSAMDDEKRAAQDQVEKLNKEKEQMILENKGLKSKADTLATIEKKVASLESNNKQLSERLAKAEGERNNLEQKQRQTSQALQDREKELKNMNQKYDQCAESNARLYTIASEVIQRFEGKSTVDKMLEKEPFTKIKKVELERAAQEYRDKIDQQKIDPKKSRSK
jgi:chromosome segregation ATPase